MKTHLLLTLTLISLGLTSSNAADQSFRNAPGYRHDDVLEKKTVQDWIAYCEFRIVEASKKSKEKRLSHKKFSLITTIDRDGRVLTVSVKNGSGSVSVDRVAIKFLKQKELFSAFPGNVRYSVATFLLNFTDFPKVKMGLCPSLKLRSLV